MTKIEKILSENIRKERKLQGLTQQALAEACEVDQPTIQRWESAKTWPQPKYIEKLASVFGISESKLFLSEDELADKKTISVQDALNILCKKLGFNNPKKL